MPEGGVYEKFNEFEKKNIKKALIPDKNKKQEDEEGIETDTKAAELSYKTGNTQ